jgi:hypothetical protein
VAIAAWAEHCNEADCSAWALAAMTAKLRRDVADSAATIRCDKLGWPLSEVLGAIDFEGIADHQVGMATGYQRRARLRSEVKQPRNPARFDDLVGDRL